VASWKDKRRERISAVSSLILLLDFKILPVSSFRSKSSDISFWELKKKIITMSRILRVVYYLKALIYKLV
jgi:hypothetical protein